MMAVLQKHILSRFQFLNLRVPGAAPDQSRSASGVYTGLVCWHECDNQESALCGRRKMLQQSVSRICDTEDIPLPRSLTRCARSFGCGERCRLTGGAEISRKKLNREAMRPRRSRFSIGSAPLTSITETDAQISGGETRQDYKDPRRFPLVAPSCALLFLPFGLPVSFRCYGRVYLIPRLTLSSGKAVRSKLDCMHEPPVQSDCCALSGNYRLESNPERHAKAPLAAATGNRISRAS